MAAVAPAGLDELRAHGDVYPTEILDGYSTALVLFAAGFYGRQDAIHIADAGLTATCVDTNAENLVRMRWIYPDGWTFLALDAYEFAWGAAQAGQTWDVVSVDCPTGAFQDCAEMIDVWGALADHAVVLGTAPRASVTPPTGFRHVNAVRRSSVAEWAVFEADG